jgi:hypothetical protein
MPEHSSYDYAIIRVTPHVERGECINIGVILFCRTQGFLDALTHLDAPRLLALAPDLDLDMVQAQLDLITLTCKGAKETGTIGEMSPSERFHWLVSPRSTIIQTSPVHCGLCADPREALEHLFQKLVLIEIPSRSQVSSPMPS